MKEYNYILVQTAYAGDDSPAYSLGNTPDNTLLFTFHYTPPYERFEQLKQLQLEARSKNPFNRDYYFAIDITEWLGHEDEEYFDIICKYLTDMAKHIRYIFMVSNRNEKTIKMMHIKLRTYMNGTYRTDERWADRNGITNVIHEISNYDNTAAQALADILMRPEFDDYRSCSFIRQISNEILNESDGCITLDDLVKYINDNNSLITLLAVGEINISKEDVYASK